MNVQTVSVVTSSPSTSISLLPVSLVLLSFASSPPLDPHPANIVPIMAALSNAAKTFFFIVVASVS